MNELEEIISNWNDWKYTSFAKTYTKSAIASVKRINKKDKERYYALLYLKEWVEKQLEYYPQKKHKKEDIINNKQHDIIKPENYDNWKPKDKKKFKLQIIKQLTLNNFSNENIAKILVETDINPNSNPNNIRTYKTQNKQILEKITQ